MNRVSACLGIIAIYFLGNSQYAAAQPVHELCSTSHLEPAQRCTGPQCSEDVFGVSCFTKAGEFKWIVPKDINWVIVYGCGAGSGGANAGWAQGARGGNGILPSMHLAGPLKPGDQISVQVGKGGVAAAGTDSLFGSLRLPAAPDICDGNNPNCISGGAPGTHSVGSSHAPGKDSPYGPKGGAGGAHSGDNTRVKFVIGGGGGGAGIGDGGLGGRSFGDTPGGSRRGGDGGVCAGGGGGGGYADDEDEPWGTGYGGAGGDGIVVVVPIASPALIQSTLGKQAVDLKGVLEATQASNHSKAPAVSPPTGQ